MGDSSDSSFYSEDSYYSSDEEPDELFFGMGGMYGDYLLHAPPSREDFLGDPARDRTAILLGELSLPVKASSASRHEHARQACLLQYSSAGPASCCCPALKQHA